LYFADSLHVAVMRLVTAWQDRTGLFFLHRTASRSFQCGDLPEVGPVATAGCPPLRYGPDGAGALPS